MEKWQDDAYIDKNFGAHKVKTPPSVAIPHPKPLPLAQGPHDRLTMDFPKELPPRSGSGSEIASAGQDRAEERGPADRLLRPPQVRADRAVPAQREAVRRPRSPPVGIFSCTPPSLHGAFRRSPTLF